MHPAATTNDPSGIEHGLSTGGRALLVAQAAKFLARAVSAMTLARLLSPDDYGLFGMASVVYGILSILRDLGVAASIQQPGLTRERFNVLFRFGLLGGIVLGVVCLASGPFATVFYHEPRLPPILAGLALCLPLAAAAAPLQALLYREGRIATAARIDAVSLAISCVVAIASAWAGAGVWALVAMAVAIELVALVMAWHSCPWRPQMHRGAMPWRGLLSFGAHLSGHGLAGYLARGCDQIVVGRFAGAPPLGIYGRGVQATALPMQFAVSPFTGWIIANLARLQGDPDAYRRFFRSALNGLAHLTLPIAAVCVSIPDVYVGLLFGERWIDAVPLVRWLGLGLAVQPWWFAYMWLLISVGETRRLLLLSLATLALFVTATVLVRDEGLIAMAAAVAVASVVAAVITLAFSLSRTPARMGDVAGASWRPWLLHTGLAAALFAAGYFVPQSSTVMSAMVAVFVGATYILVALVCWRGLRMEFQSHFLRRRATAPGSQ